MLNCGASDVTNTRECCKTYAVENKLFKVNQYTMVTILIEVLGECSGEGAPEYVETEGKKNEISVDVF